MPQGESENDSKSGRAKHLGQLALVFYHRHGTWGDFGRFLNTIFESPAAGETAIIPRMPVACRHNSGGKNHAILMDCAENPQNYPMFNHERYTRPCFSVGTWEDKKNPGLGVAALCSKAKDFLTSIGKGDPNEATGRDFDYDPAHEPPSSPAPIGASQVSDVPMPINDDDDVERERLRRLPTGGCLDLFNEFDEDDFFEDQDVVDKLDTLMDHVEGHTRSAEGHTRSPMSSTMGVPSGYHASEDSVLQQTGRLSTRIRAATLAYLWQFANDRDELKKQFRLLRRNKDLWVLHLCGCGLSYTTPEGVRVPGCVERSHLRLGSSKENEQHRHYHMTIRLMQKDDYALQCQLVHRSVDGYGVGLF